MNRRSFGRFAGLAAIGSFANDSRAELTDGSEVAQKLGEEVILEDAEVLVALDSISGALVRMVRKTSQSTIERRPDLGVSFRCLCLSRKGRIISCWAAGGLGQGGVGQLGSNPVEGPRQ